MEQGRRARRLQAGTAGRRHAAGQDEPDGVAQGSAHAQRQAGAKQPRQAGPGEVSAAALRQDAAARRTPAARCDCGRGAGWRPRPHPAAGASRAPPHITECTSRRHEHRHPRRLPGCRAQAEVRCAAGALQRQGLHQYGQGHRSALGAPARRRGAGADPRAHALPARAARETAQAQAHLADRARRPAHRRRGLHASWASRWPKAWARRWHRPN